MRARRNRIVPNKPLHAAAFAVSAAGPVVAALGVATASWNVAAVGGAILMLGKLPWIVVRDLNPKAASVPADVEGTAGELRIDGAKALGRDEIAQAYVVPRKNKKPLVRVEGKKDRLFPAAEIEMDSHEEAAALVDDLGYAPSQKAVTFETLGRLAVLIGTIGCSLFPLLLLLLSRQGLAGPTIFGGNGHPGIFMQLWLVWCGVSLSLLRVPRSVIVGPDAVETRELGTRRRWAFADVDKATFMLENASLKTRTGKTLLLRMEGSGTRLEQDQHANDSLVERLRDAWRAYAGPTVEESLAIAKRDLPAEVTTLRPNVAGWVALGVAWAAMLAATAGLVVGHTKEGLPYLVGALVVPLALQLYVTLRAPQIARREKLTVTPEGLRIGDRTIARSDLENAYFRATVGDPNAKSVQPKFVRQPRVVMTAKKRFGTTTLAVEDEAEGRAILDALALDPKKSIATFRVRGGIFANAAANMVLVVMMSQGWNLVMRLHGIWRVIGGLVMILAIVNTFWPKKLRIGAEGVLVTSPWKRQYFAFSSIEKVEGANGGLTIVTTAGERVEVRTATANGANPDRDAILQRIRAGLTAARGTHADVQLALDRGELATKEWIAKMRALSSSTDYRVAAVDPTDLWRVVEDSTAKPESRVAAAAALRVSTDDAAKERLRVASEATASPELRAALEAVAAEDDDALVRALEGDAKKQRV